MILPTFGKWIFSCLYLSRRLHRLEMSSMASSGMSTVTSTFRTQFVNSPLNASCKNLSLSLSTSLFICMLAIGLIILYIQINISIRLYEWWLDVLLIVHISGSINCMSVCVYITMIVTIVLLYWSIRTTLYATNNTICGSFFFYFVQIWKRCCSRFKF